MKQNTAQNDNQENTNEAPGNQANNCMMKIVQIVLFWKMIMKILFNSILLKKYYLLNPLTPGVH